MKSFTLIFLICLFACQSFALKEFEIHKLTQYGENNQLFGSQRASFNLLATFPTITVDNPQRRVILLPFSDLYEKLVNYHQNDKKTEEKIENELNEGSITVVNDEEFQKQIFGEVGGVLIILSEEDFTTVRNFNWEKELLNHKYSIPVYFIQNSNELQEIILSAKTETVTTPSSIGELFHWILSDSHQLALSSTEPYPLKPLPLISNLQGYIGGAGAGASTIVIIGHYDTFGASSSLSKGAQSASSASALLELIRLFNNLYNGSKLQSKFNFRFILSSGNHLNYLGSKKWLEELDEKSAKSIEFVLSLDSLLSSNEDEKLFLYSSRPAKDPSAQKLYSSFSETAKQMGINFELKINKVNLLSKEDRWEYEHFSKEKILASTISSDHSDRSLFTRNSIFDKGEVNVELLSRNIRFIAESLGKYVFGTDTENLSVFEGSLSVNDNFVELWANTLLKEQRVSPYIKEDLTNNLERTMKIYTPDVVKKTYPITNYFFFTLPTANTMTVSLVKPFVFDVALSIVLFSYLYLLYISLKFGGGSILDY